MVNEKLNQEALVYHSAGKPGKIEIRPTKPCDSDTDLALAYSPGVAIPCLKIKDNPEDVYKYTTKGNLVAIITNGTAVLGLGNIGALASKPVMEGKVMLLKKYADIDGFDIELDTTDIETFITTVKTLEPTFGAINLEDIKAPECFEIENRLVEMLNIPIMHDDQHGTAIISAAALLNACQLAYKEMSDIRLVVNGAGAAAMACTRMYITVGVKKENILMVDSKGVINKSRKDLDKYKQEFAADTSITTLKEAMNGADAFVGLSKGNTVSKEMVQSMANNAIVFALANPTPEISYEEAISAREDLFFATGRSDLPNQVNNVLGFPYIFRAALDVRATKINEDMKAAAAQAIASLAKEPTEENLIFGKKYFIPKPYDPRLLTRVSIAVAKAAIKSHVAKNEIEDWEKYSDELKTRIANQKN